MTGEIFAALHSQEAAFRPSVSHFVQQTLESAGESQFRKQRRGFQSQVREFRPPRFKIMNGNGKGKHSNALAMDVLTSCRMPNHQFHQ